MESSVHKCYLKLFWRGLAESCLTEPGDFTSNCREVVRGGVTACYWFKGFAGLSRIFVARHD